MKFGPADVKNEGTIKKLESAAMESVSPHCMRRGKWRRVEGRGGGS